MANQWFKFYGQDYLSSPTIDQLTGSERSCWVTLMCLASLRDNKIEFLDETTLFVKSGIRANDPEWEKTKGVLQKFVKFKMITLDNEVITLNKFQKRQEVNMTGYERLKKYRNKKRNDNEVITLEEIRRDKKRIEEIILPDWLNKNAWNAWLKFRKELGKTLKPSTIKFQLKLLEKNIEDHAEIIRNSITNGWTGLFPLKKNLPARIVSSQKRASENEDRQERKITEVENEVRNKLLKQSKELINK